MPRVRDAVQNALSPGDRLFTPTRKPFLVASGDVRRDSLPRGGLRPDPGKDSFATEARLAKVRPTSTGA